LDAVRAESCVVLFVAVFADNVGDGRDLQVALMRARDAIC
jgi:hypothetical protein